MNHLLAPPLFVLLLAVGCKAPPLPTDAVADDADWFAPPDLARAALGPGDLVGVAVLGHPELSSTTTGVPLDAEGRLRLPLVGSVPLAGATIDEAEARVEAALSEYVKRPDVTLWPLESRGLRYFVFGAVRQPGVYPLARDLNAYQALSLSGGVLSGGDRENVCLLRERDGFLDVHLFDVSSPNSTGLVPLHPDDMLFVRLTGSGRFREQVLPILQGVAPALSTLVSVGLVADNIND
ncbi:MAG: polysaccharide biosynthesis/export family protein [Planctomycetota bacterium]